MQIGIDLESIDQFEKIAQSSKNFLKSIFTDNELNFTNQQLAANFASKESLYKAAGGLPSDFFLKVEVLRDENNKPYFVFHQELEKILFNYEITLSISNKNNYVISIVMINKYKTSKIIYKRIQRVISYLISNNLKTIVVLFKARKSN